jgi:katanin p60 ATPase-containing subunit A1
MDEIQIIKQLDAERQAFKEVPGTVRPTSPGLPSKSCMFQPVEEYSYSGGNMGDPDVWRPPNQDAQQQYDSRRPTRAGQMAAQSRKDAAWSHSSSRGVMKGTGAAVGRGSKGNAASTFGRAGPGGRSSVSSGPQKKKGCHC